MGAHPWFYFVPYQPDLNRALQQLRRREFEAGRYNPAQPFPVFEPGSESPGPGAQHASIEEALEAADADGTRSILDVESIGEDPNSVESGVAAPIADELLLEWFGTAKPTRQMIEGDLEMILQGIGRGEAVYVIAYEDGKPSEIFLAGYSCD